MKNANLPKKKRRKKKKPLIFAVDFMFLFTTRMY